MSQYSMINKTSAPQGSQPPVSTEELFQYEASLMAELNADREIDGVIIRQNYIRTRFCSCSFDAVTDCRYHSRQEKGWRMCPGITSKEQIGNSNKGRWLFITTGDAVNLDDPTEAQDAALAERLSNELIRSVQ